MRRVLILFGLLCVLLDLADDGGLGQVKFIPPHGLHPSVAASQPSLKKKLKTSPSIITGPMGLLPGIVAHLPLLSKSKPATGVVPHTLKTIELSLLGSAGGIPW